MFFKRKLLVIVFLNNIVKFREIESALAAKKLLIVLDEQITIINFVATIKLYFRIHGHDSSNHNKA